MGADARPSRGLDDGRLSRAGWSGSAASPSPTTTRCGAGRSTTSTASGRRSSTTTDPAPRHAGTACSAGARCRAPAGSRARSSTTRRSSSAGWRRRPPGVPVPVGAAPAAGGERGGAARRRSRRPRPACAGSASRAATGSSAVIPNIPEAVVAFLACASLGAIWSSCSPDFGTQSLVDRFAQIEPTVLIAVDGYTYGGKRFDRRAVIDELRAALPDAASGRCSSRTSTRTPPGLAARRARLGGPPRRPGRAAHLRAGPVRPSALGRSTRRGRPGCPRRSSTATAASCWSMRRRSGCSSTSGRATGCRGSRRPAG